MAIDEQSTRLTAFNTCYGTFKFLRLPMGLCTSPNSFQLLMDKLMTGFTIVSVLCYLDDICVISESFQQHLSDLKQVLGRLKAAGLKLGPKKCTFATDSCIFLGHEISRAGIKPPQSRIELLTDYPVPRTRKELQRVLGMFNWFKKYIPNYSAIANPLHFQLKKVHHFIGMLFVLLVFMNLRHV